ncbi:MAG: BspA family leucine-rich repeat surface protein [Bifidobacteriaceae bacterium]|jgi:alternate signal-mediated exported protein|nr:BspA family leucine-rich repeat surface protein [Bifidobacteriaceae bacterium]
MTKGQDAPRVAPTSQPASLRAFWWWVAGGFAVATLLSLGGHGTLALWRSAVPVVPPGAISTGAVQLEADGAPSFTVAGQAFSPASQALRPGETLDISFPLQVSTTGTNMAPALTLNEADWLITPSSAKTDIVVTVTYPPLSPSAAPKQVTVVAHVAVSAGLDEDAHVDLSDVVARVTGKPDILWADTVRWDLKTVQIEGLHQPRTVAELQAAAAPVEFQIGAPGARAVILWGDGSSAAAADGANSHTYASAGPHTVTIFGTYQSIRFPTVTTAVTRWDESTGVTDLTGAFENSQVTSVVKPPSTVTSMASMFAGATLFNGSVEDWETWAVTDMSSMFKGATSFNQDIYTWTTSSVTDMSHMFEGATSFARSVLPLDIGSVTDMSYMFAGATSFNWSLGGWRNGSEALQTTASMFAGATSFNENLDGLVTETVTDTSSMFAGATSFNGNLTSWETRSVVDMSNMFAGATAFNYSIADWRTESVVDMSNMFSGAKLFNQSLNNWKTGSVTSMASMFEGAAAFNQPLSQWKTNSVVDMSNMFNGASAFIQPLSCWDVRHIAAEPPGFSAGSPLPSFFKPRWGNTPIC